jgi:hypothetical protein
LPYWFWGVLVLTVDVEEQHCNWQHGGKEDDTEIHILLFLDNNIDIDPNLGNSAFLSYRQYAKSSAIQKPFL